MELAKYLKESSVFLASQATQKEELLAEMVHQVCSEETGWNAADLLGRVRERERQRSTGFGKGLAVAHARFEACPEIKVVVARPLQPIDWDAADGQPVHFVLFVVGSEEQDEIYLKILAEINKIWSRKATRALLLSAESPDEVIRIISETRTRTHLR